MVKILTLSLTLVVLYHHGLAVSSEDCGAETESIFQHGLKANEENRPKDALALFAQAAKLCDKASYWQSLGDSADSVNQDAGPAMEAYGKAYSAARRDQDGVLGAEAARSMAELGLRTGDPIKAHEWLLIAQKLDPSHQSLGALQEEVDLARAELSTGEIEVGLSRTRGLGRVKDLLAGGASASAYWGEPASSDQQTSSAAPGAATSRSDIFALGTIKGDTGKAVETSISIPINFDSNSTSVTPGTAENLENLANVLSKQPGDSLITLTGHADVRGDAYYNLRLSRERAEFVRDILIQIEPSLKGRVQSQGRGESEPVDSGSSERGHANNRRLTVTLSE
jgi:outer membrane protein OmpA-like peptidoglycan-associated protein